VSSRHSRRNVTQEGLRVAETEQIIADILGARHRLRHLFADDRSDPLFSSHLTLTQIKILRLLSRHGTVSGGELARLLGVGLPALSGMIDRLVLQDLVVRTEDERDRRVRRIGLSRAGSGIIEGILRAGDERMRAVLSRLSAEDLETVARATALLENAAAGSPDSGEA
jgi:DNA-binding MarR family transcriptional regulator